MRYVFFFLTLMISPMVRACGADSDCLVGDRLYRISLPEAVQAPVGAVIWAHGYGGSAAGVMRNGSLRKMVHDKGLALIAAEGVDGTWDLPNGPRTPDSSGAAEFAYFEAMIADAQARFDIDPTRMVSSGFSAGGMMVWNLACARPETFVGFVPFSGTFWLTPPDDCATPAASLVHIHGDRDTTVPLDGRAIGPTRQGKVSDAMQMYGSLGSFGPAQNVDTDMQRCRQRDNPAGDILEFCLFKGGHSFRTEYLDYALQRLMAAGQL
ncbi:alpha/beta hydrolase family esterase [Sulfitobacter sp.]|uniref:alpha/beta hydrolase family esterase n=1 Tax=Sulfitobacter sp. TaxID=1903071 RepID=UPI003001175E